MRLWVEAPERNIKRDFGQESEEELTIIINNFLQPQQSHQNVTGRNN